MNAQQRVQVGVGLLIVVTVVGTIEAMRIDRPWLAVLFGIGVLVAGGVMFDCRDRRLVKVRADLVNWADRTSAATGEPVERLLDRAVSAYRADFEPTSVGRSDGGRSDG